MGSFQPSPFRSNFWIRGGHLQTILSIRPESASGLSPRSHFVEVSDGDRIILHEDSPPGNEEGALCHVCAWAVRLLFLSIHAAIRITVFEARF